MTPVPVCRHLLISGLVQGVGYRAALEREALALHLTGWVRNRRDGRVEAWLSGPPAMVTQLIEWARRGPAQAQVEAVQVTALPLPDGVENPLPPPPTAGFLRLPTE